VVAVAVVVVEFVGGEVHVVCQQSVAEIHQAAVAGKIAEAAAAVAGKIAEAAEIAGEQTAAVAGKIAETAEVAGERGQTVVVAEEQIAVVAEIPVAGSEIAAAAAAGESLLSPGH